MNDTCSIHGTYEYLQLRVFFLTFQYDSSLILEGEVIYYLVFTGTLNFFLVQIAFLKSQVGQACFYKNFWGPYFTFNRHYMYVDQE